MWKRGNGVWIRRIGICCAVSALLLCGCGPQEDQEDIVVIEQETPKVSYEFVTVEKGDVVKTRRVSCKYRQVQSREIKFTSTGRVVDRVYVENGDEVKKGQLLLELSSKDLKRRIEDLEYNIARNELLLGYVDAGEEIAISGAWVGYLSGYGGSDEGVKKQVEAIQKSNEYRREDYSDALAADRAELALLKQEYEASRIYAPMDGVVYDMEPYLMHTTSKEDQTILWIMDTSVELFEAEDPEAAKYFREGEPVPMTAGFGNDAGQYLLMPYRMEEWGETQLFTVYEAPEEGTSQVGAPGTITIVEESRENVLTLPVAAVKNASGGKFYVYVLDENDVRQVRWVETGLSNSDVVEILSGLTEGEKVILK